MTRTSSSRQAGAGTFGFDQVLDAITTQSRQLAEAVASADLEVQVPSCPEWSVRDLAHHIGQVQTYWAANVRKRDGDVGWETVMYLFPPDEDLVAWLHDCTETLVANLRDSGPDAPCWAWWPGPHTAGAVGRHQAQEAAVHRWDAQLAARSAAAAEEARATLPTDPAPLPADLAEDGVPEFIEILIGRDADALPGTVTLAATDTGRHWQVSGSEGGANESRASASKSRKAELRATASELVLMLYRRLPVPDSDVDGDPILVAFMLALGDTS